MSEREEMERVNQAVDRLLKIEPETPPADADPALLRTAARLADLSEVIQAQAPKPHLAMTQNFQSARVNWAVRAATLAALVALLAAGVFYIEHTIRPAQPLPIVQPSATATVEPTPEPIIATSVVNERKHLPVVSVGDFQINEVELPQAPIAEDYDHSEVWAYLSDRLISNPEDRQYSAQDDQRWEETNNALAPFGYRLDRKPVTGSQDSYYLYQGETLTLEDPIFRFSPLSMRADGGDFTLVLDTAHGYKLLTKEGLSQPASLFTQLQPQYLGNTLLSVDHENFNEVRVLRDGEEIYHQALEGSGVIDPLRLFQVSGEHWILETLNSVVIDGQPVNEQNSYQASFGYATLGGQPVYFFQRDGKIGLNLAGQERALDFEEVPHDQCCSGATLNPVENPNWLGFFARKGETWYYVEVMPKPAQPAQNVGAITAANAAQVHLLAEWGNGAMQRDKVFFSPGGAQLAVGTNSGLYIYNTADLSQPVRFIHSQGGAAHVALTPDWSLLAWAEGKTLSVRSMPEGETPIHTFETDNAAFVGVLITPDGKKVIGLSMPEGEEAYTVTAVVWSLETDEKLAEMEAGPLPHGVLSPENVVLSPDGRYLAAWNNYRTENLRLLPLEPGLPELEINEPVADAAFSPDLETIAVAVNGTVRLYSLTDGAFLREIEISNDPITKIAYTSVGTMLASISSDGLLRLTRVADGKMTDSFHVDDTLAWSLVFDPTDKTLALATDNQVQLFPMADGGSQGIATAFLAQIESLAFTQDGSLAMLTASSQENLWIWNPLEPEAKLSLNGAGSMRMAGSPDGAWLGFVMYDGSIMAAGMPAFEPLQKFELNKSDYEAHPFAVSFSADGSLVAGGAMSLVRVWNTASGEIVYERFEDQAFIPPVALSPDGQWVAVMSNGLIIIYPLDGSENDWRIEPWKSAYALSLAWSPDSQRLYVGCRGQVQVYRTADHQVDRTIEVSPDDPFLLEIAVSPDGSVLATSDEGTIALWNTADGSQIVALPVDHTGISKLAFSPDGSRLASSAGGVAQVWGVK